MTDSRKVSQKVTSLDTKAKRPSKSMSELRSALLVSRLADLDYRQRDEPDNYVIQGAAREIETAIGARDHSRVDVLLSIVDSEPRGFGLGSDGVYRPPSVSQQREEARQERARRRREEAEAERLLGQARYYAGGMGWEPDA